MHTIHILIEGYAHASTDGGYVASPSTVLIETEDKKILVDPGANPEKLLSALKKLSLTPQDISFIYITHYHPDHWLNVRLFPNKDILDGGILWRGDEEIFHKDYIPGTNIEILPTPGHCSEHTSLLVETEEGIVCIAQDVFWWEDGAQKTDSLEALMELADPFATDVEAQKKSRQMVLERADWIIPGHGKKFRSLLRKKANHH